MKPEAQQHLERAIDFRLKGMPLDCLSELEEAFQYHPIDKLITKEYLKTAVSIGKSGEVSERLILLAEITDNAHYYYLAGQIVGYYGDGKRAREAYRKAIKLNPNYDIYYVAITDSYLADNLTADAYNALTVGIHHSPDSELLWISKTYLATELKKWNDVDTCAVKLKSSFTSNEAIAALGFIAQSRRYYNEARQAFEYLTKEEPTNSFYQEQFTIASLNGFWLYRLLNWPTSLLGRAWASTFHSTVSYKPTILAVLYPFAYSFGFDTISGAQILFLVISFIFAFIFSVSVGVESMAMSWLSRQKLEFKDKFPKHISTYSSLIGISLILGMGLGFLGIALGEHIAAAGLGLTVAAGLIHYGLHWPSKKADNLNRVFKRLLVFIAIPSALTFTGLKLTDTSFIQISTHTTSQTENHTQRSPNAYVNSLLDSAEQLRYRQVQIRNYTYPQEVPSQYQAGTKTKVYHLEYLLLLLSMGLLILCPYLHKQAKRKSG